MLSEYGKVLDIFLIGDKHPMCSVIVSMETDEGRQKAIDDLNATSAPGQ